MYECICAMCFDFSLKMSITAQGWYYWYWYETDIFNWGMAF